MEIKNFTYKVQGVTPLLMHNPQGMMVDANGAAPSKAKRIPSPTEEAELGAYRTADGILAVPAIAIRNCTITAAGAFKHKTRSWRTFVSHIQIEPSDLLMLSGVGPKAKPLTEYEIDTRRCVIKGRGAILRSRPLIKEWQTSFTFIVDVTMLPTDEPRELLKAFLLEAGSRIGIGDYRPEKTGWFGRFTVID
jgi:hypothetical protein